MLESSIDELKGVGKKYKEELNKLGVYTIQDMLLAFPYNYIQYPDICKIEDLQPDQLVAVKGILSKVPYRVGGRLQVVTSELQDETGKLSLVWYRQPFIKNVLSKGETYVLYGRLRKKQSSLTLEQGAIYSEENYQELIQGLSPVYHLSAGLKNKSYSKFVLQALKDVNQLKEFFDADLLKRYDLMSKPQAVQTIHFPKSFEELLRARRRIAFEEFFTFLLKLNLGKQAVEISQYALPNDGFVLSESEKLNFKLTLDQQKALSEILNDLSLNKPMQRLLQGDVGSGKTIIAFLAMLQCSHHQYQSAFMAPTEVLAKQHYHKLLAFMEKYDLKDHVYLLTGSLTPAQKRKEKEKIKEDPYAMVVGTHALLTEDVCFEKLALVITDEQHRFGVKQRETLSQKGDLPHTLIMSATPIPRTLSIILYGDLDVSLIKTMPANRLPIKNCVVNTSYRKTAYEFIKKEVLQGHQAYVICPLVEESEGVDACNVQDYTESLQEYYQDSIKVGMLHGKMKQKQKDSIMDDFANNKIQVLVSTTVVEVGVDVPNATVMMIEDAQRFGLAQLHQLRGRVGRGDAQSYCIFIDGKNSKDNPRLKVLNTSNDGFFIAEQDLKLRGPGDVFGVRQSGEMDFCVADIFQDFDLLKDASDEVNKILETDGELKLPEHEFLRAFVTM